MTKTFRKIREEAFRSIEIAHEAMKLAAGAESNGIVRLDHYENTARMLRRAGDLLDPSLWDEPPTIG